MEVVLSLIALTAGIALVWAVFSLLWIMAEERGQPPWLWVLLCFAIAPLAHLALWVFFDTQDEDEQGK